MRVENVLTLATKRLQAADIGTAHLDALVLLEDAIGKDRTWLLAHPEEELGEALTRKLDAQVERRASHEPLAYVRGHVEFYGRSFKVNKNVLVPRPESETMIELYKVLPVQGPLRIADIGTGSGALGITAALEARHPVKRLDLFDIDENCLDIAADNARRLGVKAQLIGGDLLTPGDGPYDILLANLPYVPDSYHINEAALIEPRQAIFGGPDGLELYRRLFGQLEHTDWQPQYILTESLPFQHQALRLIAANSGYSLYKSDDFIQIFTPIKALTD